MEKIYIGIDNGVSGAYAALSKDGEVLCLRNLPVTIVGKDKRLDVVTLRADLAALAIAKWPIIIAEQAQKFSPGKMALCSTWRSWGSIETVLDLNNYQWEPINPAAWQKVMFNGHVRAADQDSKNAAIVVAGRLFPNQSLLRTPGCKKPDSGLADALLISEFARRHR